MKAIFRTEALSKIYDAGNVKVRALDGVTLQLFEGEFVVLLGPSGSGKSTLLNILGGLDRASSGRVFFRDRDLTRLGHRELTRFRRDHVGFVFQFYNLVPSLTARENVQLVTDIAPHPMPPEEALKGINDRFGTATAVITHNAAIRKMAHRVIRFSDGRVAQVEENAIRIAPAEIAW